MSILDKNNKEEIKDYESFIKNYDGSSFMQSLSWGKVKSNWIQESVYIKEDDKIVIAMTILIQKLPHINKSMMYAPRGPVGDINNIELVNKLVKEVDVLSRKYKAFVLKFDPQIEYSDKLDELYRSFGYKTSGKNPVAASLIQPNHNMVVDIFGKSSEQVLDLFASKTRYNIRLSQKKGIKTYYSNSKEDLKKFYDIYQITATRDGFSLRPYEYFENMLDSYDKENIRIYLTEYEGEILAGAVTLNYGKEVVYLYGASSNEKRNYMPTYSMQWEMIKWAIETGSNTYNLGGLLGLDNNNGLYRFKIGFCSEKGIKEYIGEIDKVYNKPIYFLYSKVLPWYRTITRKLKGLNTH